MNAKEEILELLLKKNKQIKCAIIVIGAEYNKNRKTIILKVNYTSKEYDIFINNLDFKYDNGFGGQEIYGTIWFKDNTWANRGEYDGSEWWKVQQLPKIPKELQLNLFD